MLRKDLLRNSGIYLVTDRKFLQGRDITVTISRALEAGVDMVQYRDKEASDREFLEVGKRIKKLLQERDALFLVDDRVDLAFSLDSDGVHLGESDMPVEKAREILGKGKIIGLSTHSIDQMREAVKKDIDYISIGPIFPTPTKPDYTAVGLGPVEIAAHEIRLPFVAIGGINESNIEDVLNAGAKRVAVVRAILCAKDPFIAARNLIKKMDVFQTHNAQRITHNAYDSIRTSKTK